MWKGVAVCVKCWFEKNPGRTPVQLRPEHREVEKCHYCGDPTNAGIYVRAQVGQ